MGHFSIPPQTMNITPKNKSLDLDILQHLEQLLGLGWVISVHVKKGPLSHQKMKCLFLDYVQLLMISRVI